MYGHCIICSETFVATSDVSATPCGHTFHQNCLMQWLGRSKTCPKCRNNAPLSLVIPRLFFDGADLSLDEDPSHLRDVINSLEVELREKDRHVADVDKQLIDAKAMVLNITQKVGDLQIKVSNIEQERDLLKTQLDYLSKENHRLAKLEIVNAKLDEKLRSYKELAILLEGSQAETRSVLMRYGGDGSSSTKQLATYCASLQSELQKTTKLRNSGVARLREMAAELSRAKNSHELQLKYKEAEIEDLKNKITNGVKTKSMERTEKPSFFDISSDYEDNDEYSDCCAYVLEGAKENMGSNDVKIVPLAKTSADGREPTKYKVSSPALVRTSTVPSLDNDAGTKRRANSTLRPVLQKKPFMAYNIMQNRQSAGAAPGSKKPTTVAAPQGYNGLGGHSKQDHVTNVLPKRRLRIKIDI